jgi:hypothetical protein
MIIKDLILSHLRQRKIKLWLAPYYRYSSQVHDSNSDGINKEALRGLAYSLLTAAHNENANDTARINVDEVYEILIELQSPAVKKYIEKHSIDIKIVGSMSQTDIDLSSVSSHWGDGVSLDKIGSTVIRVVNILSSLTAGRLSTDLSKLFGNSAIRLIYRGKNLSTDVCIQSAVMKNDGTKKEILCLVSKGVGTKSGTAKSVSATNNSTNPDSNVTRTDETIIAFIRQAAQTLRSSSSAFEITNQSGELVSMSQDDSTAFLTALGLHRLGRSKLENTNLNTFTPSQDAASALTFLLEADAEWKNSAALTTWIEKVDNYGLLQLDIAWCYLLLGSLDNLPDAIARLEMAETVLRKQVHSNFVTLALAQADMNNQIPPLCSVFVRLFLLQGVAYKTMHRNGEADKRLGWARLLCQQLRASSPSDMVAELCNVYSLTDPSVVISALRQKNGNPDEAGDLIAANREEDMLIAKKRHRQREIGKCSNLRDWVNVDHVVTLAGMLGLDVNDNCRCASSISEDDGDGPEDSMSMSIVTGLLRLTNNDIEESLQLYTKVGADKILEQVDALDKLCGKKKRQKESHGARSKKHKVHDVDLVTLISMGVDDSHAREALKATGSVDAALVWLSTVDTKNDSSAAAAHDGDVKRSSDESEKDSSAAASGRGPCNEPETHSDDDAEEAAREEEELEAEELLKAELGRALHNSKNLLEKEWFGLPLNDEWDLIEKYCSKEDGL